jgi:hypothetical protein
MDLLLSVNELIKEKKIDKEDLIFQVAKSVEKNQNTIRNYLAGRTPATLEFFQSVLGQMGVDEIEYKFADSKTASIPIRIEHYVGTVGRDMKTNHKATIYQDKINIENQELKEKLKSLNDSVEMYKKLVEDKDKRIEELQNDKQRFQKLFDEAWERLNNKKGD